MIAPALTQSNFALDPSALAKRLQQFEKEVATIKNSAPGLKPGAPREVQELKIESWAQVPLGLKALNEGKSVLWTYPDPETQFADRHQDEIDAIKQEQKDISEFIAKYHNKPLVQMAAELETNVTGCYLFQRLPDANQQQTSAKKWISSSAVPSSSTRSFRVSYIIEEKDLNDTKKQTELDKLTDSLNSLGSSKPKTIFKFDPTSHYPTKKSDDELLKDTLDNSLSGTSTSDKVKSLLQNISEVWVSSGSEVRVLEGNSCIEAAQDKSNTKKPVALPPKAYLGEDLYQQLWDRSWPGSLNKLASKNPFALVLPWEKWHPEKDQSTSLQSTEESESYFDPFALVLPWRNRITPKNRRRSA